MSTERYIQDLVLSPAPEFPRHLAPDVTRKFILRADATGAQPESAVDGSALLSFVDGISPQERDDVLFSVQLAVRGASGSYDRYAQTEAWYRKFVEILERLGWTSEQFAFVQHKQEEGDLRMDKAALALIASIATQNQLAVLDQAIKSLEQLADDDKAIRLFDFHTSKDGSGNFQMGAVQKSSNDALAMALGAFHFVTHDARHRILFVQWGAHQVDFWTAAQKLTLNLAQYVPLRDAVRKKLGGDALDFIADLKV